MENKKLKEYYEEFHKKCCIQTKVLSSNNFTYHIVLAFIDKYLRPNMKVLDIGCGIGTISLYIASKGNKVLGIDISEKAINAAQKTAELLGIENASFRAVNFLDVDFEEKFDFVIFSEVLEHLPDDKFAIKKIYNLLRANGILFLSTCLERDPMHKIRIRLLGKDKFDISVGHLRRYSKEELTQLLESNGFKIREIKQTEGLLRMFLFTTKTGNRLLNFANLPVIRSFLTLLDSLSVHLLGPSQIIIIAEAVKGNTNYSDPWEEEVRLKYLQSLPIYWFRRNFIEKNISIKNGMKVLEAGSGPAHDSIIFAENGANVTAVDLSENALRNAKKIYSELGYPINTINANITKLPFADNYFDLTWNAGVLEHFNDSELEKVFQEMVRVTKRSGLILVFVPNKFYFWYQMHLKTAKNRQYEFERAYSIFKLKRLFEANGLKNIKVSGVHVHPVPSFIVPKTGVITEISKKGFNILEKSTKFGNIKSLLGLDVCIWGYKQ